MNCCLSRRKFQYKTTPIDNTTQIYFPFDRFKCRFVYSEYEPNMTNYRLSYEEVRQFFIKIYQATDHFDALQDCCEPKSYALLLFLPLGIVASGIYTCLADVNRLQDKIICQAFTLLLSIIVTLMIISCIKSRVKKYKMARNTIEAVIAENSEYYSSKGIVWKLNEGFLEYIILNYHPNGIISGGRQGDDLLEALI